MTNILLIKSSPRGSASHSSRMADKVMARLQAQHPGATVLERDLAAQPLPHIGAEFSSGTLKQPEQRSAAEVEALKLSDSVLGEVQAADFVVVATAMINFGIPAVLKNWIDHLMRLGMAFTYTADGPLGLLNGKKVYIVASRGGAYGPERRDWDFQLPYMEKMFQFMGITDQTHIVVEPTLAGEEVLQAQLDAAMERIEALSA